jgi:type II secretory pathway pseudopilin PulG
MRATLTTSGTRDARGFSLVEAAVSTVIVALMFGAAMAAMGVSARDRLSRSHTRMGDALAQRLMAEILQRRFEFPAGSGIGRASGTPTADRTRWLDVDDYFDLDETPPRDRLGRPIPGTAGWRWAARVEYVRVSGGTVSGAGTAVSDPLVSLNLLGTAINVGSRPAETVATDLKRVTVRVTSPQGRVTTLTGLRSAYGATDRVAGGTGFTTHATVDLRFGPEGQGASVGVPMLNTPAR